MNQTQITEFLQSIGQTSISFEDGTISSIEGEFINYWYLKDGKLVCYDARFIQKPYYSK